MIEIVGKEAVHLFRDNAGFHLAINMSASDFHDKKTFGLLEELISETGARNGSLVIEATETSLLNSDRAKDVIEKVHAKGILVSLDDFGMGYSSLSYLEKFKFDYLKIDKSFVDKIGTDAPTNSVVLHIIEMAKAMDIKMIAEGVETEEQAAFLRARGVQYAQGWLFGRPMGLDQVLKLAGNPSSAGVAPVGVLA